MPLITTKYGKTKTYDTPLYPNPESVEELFSVKSIDDSGIFELGRKKQILISSLAANSSKPLTSKKHLFVI